MKPKQSKSGERGKIQYLMLWLIGIPLPIVLLIYFLGGCG
jgi:hypothetical protein